MKLEFRLLVIFFWTEGQTKSMIIFRLIQQRHEVKKNGEQFRAYESD